MMIENQDYTKNKLKIKQIIAREVLLFFAGFALLILIFFFLVLRNLYYEQKRDSLTKKLTSLSAELNSLPSDYIKELYDKISKYMVVNYRFENENYIVTKEREYDFIYDEYGIKKQITALPTHATGYFYFKRSDSLKIRSTEPRLLFDFVEFNIFRGLLLSKDYEDKLYHFFSDDEWGEPAVISYNAGVTKDGLPILNRYEIYDLGSIDEFASKVQSGLKYSKDIGEGRAKIINEKSDTEKNIDNTISDILDNSAIEHFIIYTAAIFGITLYPLRFFYFLISWSIKTLKEREN